MVGGEGEGEGEGAGNGVFGRLWGGSKPGRFGGEDSASSSLP